MSENKQEQPLEQRTEQEETTALENTAPSTMPSLSCPECGKSFERETLKQAYRAVKGHCLAAHKRKLTRADFGLEKVGKETPTQPREPYVSRKRQPIREEGESLVPDVETQLSNFLVTFGLSSRDSSAVVEYLRSFGFDNLVKLNHALSDIGVSLSRRRLVIEAWANARDIRIPPQIAQSLTIKPYRHYQPSYDYEYEEEPYGYGYGYQRPRKRREEEEEESYRRGKDIGEIRAKLDSLTNNPASSEIPSSVQNQLNNLQNRLSEKDKEIAELKESKRMAEFKNMIDGAINPITKELSEIKASQDKISNQYSLMETLIKSGSGLMSESMKLKYGQKGTAKPKEERTPPKEEPDYESMFPEEMQI
jgi:hypothetical protein